MSEPTLIPYIVVRDAAAAIEFYKKAFGAVEIGRHLAPGTNKIMHARVSIDGNTLMLSDDFSEEMGYPSMTPESLGGSPLTLHLRVENADITFERAINAGAMEIMPPQDQFWGDRYAQFVDPLGHRWAVLHTIKQMTPEEVDAAAKKYVWEKKEAK